MTATSIIDRLEHACHRHYLTARTWQRLRAARSIRRQLRGDHAPVLIFQMGKVGSTSVYDSLRTALGDRPLFHLHSVDPHHLRWLDRRFARAWPRTRRIPMHFIEGAVISRHLQRPADSPWNIISLVRDPVARNVSAFFQNLEIVAPDFNLAARLDNTAPDDIVVDLTDRFLNDASGHDRPLRWFDDELARHFGIDVYATPFDFDRGTQIATGPHARALIMRLDDLDRVGADAIGAFLDVRNFQISRGNSAHDKLYYPVYRRFVETIRLPDEYLDRLYDSRFTRHFYTPDEIARFRARWSRTPLRAAG